MSGGSFNYHQRYILEIAEDVEEIIRKNDITDKDQYGDTIGCGFSVEIMARFNEAATVLRRAAIMAQRIDWLLSGDDGPESFMRRWDEELTELEAIK